jgi:putative ATP-dependent endonuclease of OLD family
MNAEDSRRIAFHIRFNRASSLFARCWLLVEGRRKPGLSTSWPASAAIILMRKG